jgi:hypothetical protein
MGLIFVFLRVFVWSYFPLIYINTGRNSTAYNIHHVFELSIHIDIQCMWIALITVTMGRITDVVTEDEEEMVLSVASTHIGHCATTTEERTVKKLLLGIKHKKGEGI